MYSICSGRNFHEIAAHAVAFRLAIDNLRQSALLSGEETFFAECMWEKVVWTMTRELLFRQKLTPKSLKRLAEFAQPLFLSEYKDQPIWIQEAYSEVRVKIDLIRSLTYFELYAGNELPLVKVFLAARFARDFVRCVGSQINRSNPICWESRRLLRMISRKIWVRLLAFVSGLVLATSGDASIMPGSPRIIEEIKSMFSVVDLIPEPEHCVGLRAELFNVVDMALCSLVLMGLAMSELQLDENSFLL
jgi:hypothetical protein